MKSATALVWIMSIRAVAVSAAVGIACYVTASGWPVLGLLFVAGSVKFGGGDGEGSDDE